MSPNPKQFQEAYKVLLIFNLTSTHSFDANCVEDNVGKSFALSQFFNFNDMPQEHVSEETASVDTEQAAVPAPVMNEICLDVQKIITNVSLKKHITECPTCSNNINNIELGNFIEHVGSKLELAFNEICCKPKITQVIQTFLEEDQHLLLFSLQCKPLRTIIFKTVAREFVTVWCKYINDILFKKVAIQSTNYMYKAAQKMSLKYTKK